jgi:quercetin dioxygenase-like cupin family protein
MIKISKQIFSDAKPCEWKPFGDMRGVSFVPLAEPVPEGSIHRARLAQGTVIPTHTHPADEYVLVVSGTVETGGRRCETGTFWITPANIKQGPHVAITDAEILTIRLGALGKFEL